MPSVKEVIETVKAAGLVVQLNPARGGHTLWDIVDPSTGTILTGISGSAGKTGGDPNWHHNIRRMLRRAGFSIDYGDGRRSTSPKGKTGKRKPAIDLDALAKAQAQARAAGVHVPTLEDLDEHPEFFRRTKSGPNPETHPLSENASDEVIEGMSPKVEAPRFNATVQRLRTQLETKYEELEQRQRDRYAAEGKRAGLPTSAKTEFVRIAVEEVAPARDLRAWKSVGSGIATLTNLLEGKQSGASLWNINLIEATMDHIDGLKWGVIDESKKKKPPITTLPDGEQGRIRDSVVTDAGPLVSAEEPEKLHDAETLYAFVEEYENSLKTLTEYGIGHSLTKEEWDATADKSGAALHAVATLLSNHNQLQDTQFDREVHEPVFDGSIREGYATALLDILANYTAEKGDYLLDQVLARLDKLAGI